MNSLLIKTSRPALIGLFVLSTLTILSGCERRTPQSADSGTTSSTGTTGAPGAATSSALGAAAPGTSESASAASGTPSSPGSTTGTTAGTGGAGTGEPGTGSSTDTTSSGMGGAGTGSSASGSTGATGAPPTGTGTASMSAADRNFLETVARVNLAEIEASRLAADHASAQAVKAFADTMIRDHGSMGQQLRDLASRKGVTLPAQPRATDLALMTRLRAARGTAFDRLYTEQIGVNAHKEAVTLFEQAAQNASDPDVKSFALGGAPALRNHLTMAQSLPGASASGSMGGAGTGGTSSDSTGSTGTSGTGNTDTTAPRPRQSRG